MGWVAWSFFHAFPTSRRLRSQGYTHARPHAHALTPARLHARMPARRTASTPTRPQACTFALAHINYIIYTHPPARACTRARMHACTQTHTNAHTRKHANTQTHRDTSTQAHKHTQATNKKSLPVPPSPCPPLPSPLPSPPLHSTPRHATPLRSTPPHSLTHSLTPLFSGGVVLLSQLAQIHGLLQPRIQPSRLSNKEHLGALGLGLCCLGWERSSERHMPTADHATAPAEASMNVRTWSLAH